MKKKTQLTIKVLAGIALTAIFTFNAMIFIGKSDKSASSLLSLKTAFAVGENQFGRNKVIATVTGAETAKVTREQCSNGEINTCVTVKVHVRVSCHAGGNIECSIGVLEEVTHIHGPNCTGC